MVVDHIENDGETALVGGVDETFERVLVAVSMVGRIQTHAVVAPIPAPWKVRDRHELEDRHAEDLQLVEMACGSVEGAFASEGANVHLVYDLPFHFHTWPGAIRPHECVAVHHHRRTVRTLRLEARARIGIRAAVV